MMAKETYDSSMQRILIIRSGALGDTIFASATMSVLHQAFPKSRFDWIISQKSLGLFEYDQRVENAFILKYRKLPIPFSREKQSIIRRSKRLPYDLVLNLEHHPSFVTLAQKISAKQHLHIGDFPVAKNAPGHAVDSMKQPLYALIDSAENSELTAPKIQDASPDIIGRAFSHIETKFTLPKHYLVLCPGNSHSNQDKINHRAWPQPHWLELIQHLSQQHTLVIVGCSADKALIQQWALPKKENIIDLTGQTQLSELFSVIKHAQLVITTDSGPTHIASAVHTPNIALLGPTDPNNTGPYQTPSNTTYLLNTKLDCQPCYGSEQQRKCVDNQCMKQLSPQLVRRTVEQHLNSPKANA